MGSNPIQIANASVAQSVEQGTENPRVIGSIPIGGTKEYVVLSAEADEEAAYSFLADLAHLVERHLAKVEVASSSLVIRSIALYYLFHCGRCELILQRLFLFEKKGKRWKLLPLFVDIYSLLCDADEKRQNLLLTGKNWQCYNKLIRK